MQTLTPSSRTLFTNSLRIEGRFPLVILGFDGTPGPWLFRSLKHLPNFARVFAEASYGELRSCDPPVTVPAWACLFSGLDPGELGLYGFRHRYGHDPEQHTLVHSGLLPSSMLWYRAREQGQRCVSIGVPPSYPPPALPGATVGCFLTPERAVGFAEPRSVAERIRQKMPRYRFDVADFRNRPREETWFLLVEMARSHFEVARDLAREEEFNLFVMVEIGSDRVQHLFWENSLAPEAEPWNGTQPVCEYYKVLDQELGGLLDVLGDDVHLWLVSDHGAQSLRGGVFLNEWLIRNGYLQLLDHPKGLTPLRLDSVDWSRTVAWAEGGYVGRVYLNVRGRQSRGVLSVAEAARLQDEIAAGLSTTLVDHEGRQIMAEAWCAQDRYRSVTGLPPDLFVYLDDLRCRAFGTVGSEQLWSSANDLGTDCANHHPLGFYAYRPPASAGAGYCGELSLTELYSIFLAQMGVDSLPVGRGSMERSSG